MADIGGGWKKKDKNGKAYISFSIDRALLPLTIDDSKRLAVFPIKEKTNENAPDFRLVLFSNEDLKTKPEEGEEIGTDEDIPF